MRKLYLLLVLSAAFFCLAVGVAPAAPAPTTADDLVEEVPDSGASWELPACGLWLPALDDVEVCHVLEVHGWFTVDYRELPSSYQATLWVERPNQPLWTIVDTVDWNDFPGWVSAIFESKLKIWSAGEYRLRLRISDQDGTECISNLSFWTVWAANHCLMVSPTQP